MVELYADTVYVYSRLGIEPFVADGGKEILKAQRTIIVSTEHGKGNGMAKLGLETLAQALATAMIAALCGCHHESAHAPPAAPAPRPVKAADLSAARLAAGEPDQWLTPGRDANGTFYSPLADINAGNVAKLGFAWDYDLRTNRGQQSTPLVIDGVMYASSNFGRVYALDAASGKELWTYDPHIDGQWARYACCDVVNRGLAAFEGRVYVGALDGWLHALDARTGQLAWKVDTLIGRGNASPTRLRERRCSRAISSSSETAAPISPGPVAMCRPTISRAVNCVGDSLRCRAILPRARKTSRIWRRH